MPEGPFSQIGAHIYIHFGSKLSRQIVGIPTVLIVPLLLRICFYFVLRMTSCCLYHKNHAIVIIVFTYTSIYLDALLNNDNRYFERMISQIIQLSTNLSDTETPPFWTGACQ